MHYIDLQTLFFLFSIGNFFVIIILLAYMLSNKQDVPVFRVFLLARFLYVLQTILYFSEGHIGSFYSQGVANVLFIFATFYDIFSIVNAKNEFASHKFSQYHILPVLLSIVYLILLDFNEPIPTAVLSFIVVIYYTTGTYFLLHAKTRFKMQQFISIFYILTVIIFFTKAITVLSVNDPLVLFTPDSLNVVSFTFLMLMSMFLVVVLLLILKEKDEAKIKNDNRTLNELIGTKDKFFSIIAHDLKNPIGAMSQLGELLMESHTEIPLEEREHLIATINKASKSTYSLLNNLLQWARVESGELTAKPVVVDVQEAVENNLNLLSHSISAKSLVVKSDLEKKLMAFFDIEMLNTIIRNILSNAIKFTPEQGVIMISAHKYEVRNVVAIRFTDSGVGMSQEDIRKVMNLDSIHTTPGTNKEKGTGLGIKLCKEFLAKNNGALKIESDENVGSSFTIIIPMPK